MTSKLEMARAALARAEAAAASGSGLGSSAGGTPRVAAGVATSSDGAGRAARGSAGGTSGGEDAEPDQDAVARNIVLRQLAMAPRSRAQLEDKLRARACPPEVAGRVLDRFTELGLIDDEAYAQTLVRSRRQTKGLARRALAHELRRTGVSDDIAQQSLASIEADDEADQARRLVDKRLRSLHGLDASVQTRRLAGMLARKGYGSSLAYRVIREALADSPEHRRD
nr:regulatory protein RecX [Kineosphaera limosa]